MYDSVLLQVLDRETKRVCILALAYSHMGTMDYTFKGQLREYGKGGYFCQDNNP